MGQNYHISIAGHIIIFIDALGLVEEYQAFIKDRWDAHKAKPLPGGTIEFVNNFALGMFLFMFFSLLPFTDG